MAADSPNRHVKLTEMEVRKILARAAELEADPRSVTLADLERAATEAGISSAAVEAAAKEVLSRPSLSTERHAPFWIHGVLATLGGALFGGVMRVVEEFVEPNLLVDVPFTVVLIAFSLILAARVKHREERPATHFDILGLWVGTATGWAIVAQQVTPDLIFGLGGLGLATAAVASVIMHMGTSNPIPSQTHLTR